MNEPREPVCDAWLAFSSNGFECCLSAGHDGHHVARAHGRHSHFPHGTDHQVKVPSLVSWPDAGEASA